MHLLAGRVLLSAGRAFQPKNPKHQGGKDYGKHISYAVFFTLCLFHESKIIVAVEKNPIIGFSGNKGNYMKNLDLSLSKSSHVSPFQL
jgi:hypothetical protein